MLNYNLAVAILVLSLQYLIVCNDNDNTDNYYI